MADQAFCPNILIDIVIDMSANRLSVQTSIAGHGWTHAHEVDNPGWLTGALGMSNDTSPHCMP